MKVNSGKLTFITNKYNVNDEIKLNGTPPDSPAFRDGNYLDSPVPGRAEDRSRLTRSNYRGLGESQVFLTAGYSQREIQSSMLKKYPYRNPTSSKTGMHLDASGRRVTIRQQASNVKVKTRIEQSSKSRAMSSKMSRLNSFKDDEDKQKRIENGDQEACSNKAYDEKEDLSIDEAPVALENFDSPLPRRRVDSETFSIKFKDLAVRRFRKSQQFNLLSSRASPTQALDRPAFMNFERGTSHDPAYHHASSSMRFTVIKSKFEGGIFNSALANTKAITLQNPASSASKRKFSVRNFVKDRYRTKKTKIVSSQQRKGTTVSQDQSQANKEGRSMNMDVVVPVHAELTSMDSLNDKRNKPDQLKSELRRHDKRAIKSRVVQFRDGREGAQTGGELVSTTPDLTLRLAKRYKPKPLVSDSIACFRGDMANYLHDLRTKTLTKVILSRKQWQMSDPNNT